MLYLYFVPLLQIPDQHLGQSPSQTYGQTPSQKSGQKTWPKKLGVSFKNRRRRLLCYFLFFGRRFRTTVGSIVFVHMSNAMFFKRIWKTSTGADEQALGFCWFSRGVCWFSLCVRRFSWEKKKTLKLEENQHTHWEDLQKPKEHLAQSPTKPFCQLQ